MDAENTDIFADIERQWKNLTIQNDYVFGKTMLDEGLCVEVLEAILDVPIERVEYIGRQEVLDASPDSKGVRLDVYVRDEVGTVYNVEMQSTDTRELPRRARYYQSMMTFDQIGRGEPYKSLKDSFVIFICGFDPFHCGRRVYSFENRCIGNESLALGDGARTIFLAASAPRQDDESDRLNELLDYVESGTVSGEFSFRLDAAVDRVLDNRNWRLEYMMLVVRDQLNIDKGISIGREIGIELGRAEGEERGRAEGLELGRAEGKERGRAEGLELGRAEGEERLARLNGALIRAGRMDDLAKACGDPAVRARLYAELGID